METSSIPATVVRFGMFEADFRTGELRKGGIRIKVQELPFRALRLFLSRPNEILTREEFRQALWPEDVHVDFDRGISSAINRLRDALSDTAANPRYIETVPRAGYRWIAPVQAVEAATAPTQTPSDPKTPLDSAPTASPVKHYKRIALLVTAAFGLVAVVALIWQLVGQKWRRSSPSVRSVAVLPFSNLTGDPAQDYLAAGMTDELTTELARISSLRVVSRTSVQQYRNGSKSLPMIAKELNVDAVVEGSVQEAGDELRVTVQLVDARNDRNLWADTMARSLGSASSLQHELAQEIANQVGVQLTPLEQRYFAGRHPVAPESFQAYLQGRFYWNKRTPEGLNKAEQFFQEAVNADPNSPLAYAGLADTYLLDSLYTRMPQQEAFQKARAAAEKAIALDDQLAEAHCSAAYVRLLQDWDFAGAEKEFKRALELNPNFATAHQWYAEMLSLQTRHDEARAHIRRAEELDPYSMIIHHEAGQILQNARLYKLALDEYHKAQELAPDFAPAHYSAAVAHRRLGEFEDALREMRIVAALDSDFLDPHAVTKMSEEYARSGPLGYVRELLQARRLGNNPGYFEALDYAVLGESDKAFDSLQRAYRNHDFDVLQILCSPELDPLRSDPRFLELRKKTGL